MSPAGKLILGVICIWVIASSTYLLGVLGFIAGIALVVLMLRAFAEATGEQLPKVNQTLAIDIIACVMSCAAVVSCIVRPDAVGFGIAVVLLAAALLIHTRG